MSKKQNADLIELKQVTHSYSSTTTSTPILQDVSLLIEAGQSCAIVGQSGSGKSTLLNIIGLLDRPISGQLLLNGQNMAHASVNERASLRNKLIGFVFQSFNLLPRLNALDNVALPLLYRGHSQQVARQAAQQQLERVGLAERINHLPADLSGGQRQRVAIARALVGEPLLLLADEPTGNLDSQTSNEILELLLTLNTNHGVTLVIVTHDESIARQMQRRILVLDGGVHES